MIGKLYCGCLVVSCCDETPTKEVEVQPSEYRVLVSGWRGCVNKMLVHYELDKIHRLRRITTLIHGGARGADSIAHGWAVLNNVPIVMYPAQWDVHGKSAGPIRNQQMLDEGKAELVIAFLSPKSVGTLDMLARAKKAQLQTYVVMV